MKTQKTQTITIILGLMACLIMALIIILICKNIEQAKTKSVMVKSLEVYNESEHPELWTMNLSISAKLKDMPTTKPISQGDLVYVCIFDEGPVVNSGPQDRQIHNERFTFIHGIMVSKIETNPIQNDQIILTLMTSKGIGKPIQDALLAHKVMLIEKQPFTSAIPGSNNLRIN